MLSQQPKVQAFLETWGIQGLTDLFIGITCGRMIRRQIGRGFGMINAVLLECDPEVIAMDIEKRINGEPPPFKCPNLTPGEVKSFREKYLPLARYYRI
jgi:hypothetical protein